VEVSGEQRDRDGRAPARSWAGAGARALLVLVLSWLAFLLVPDRLLVFLTTRVAPRTRDALVTLWVVVSFVVLSWVFVALQRERRA
jgi:hypothetical protein